MKRIILICALALASAGSALGNDGVLTADSRECNTDGNGIEVGSVSAVELPENYRRRVWPLEMEVWLLGVNHSLCVPKGYTPSLGWDSGVELRYNINRTPYSVGLMVGSHFVQMADKEMQDEGVYDSCALRRDAGGGLIAGPVFEYDYFRGEAGSMFTSVSAGYCVGENKRGYIRAKAGVELLNLLRLSLSAFYAGDHSLSIGCNVGLVIGGWPRKAKVKSESRTVNLE